MSVRRWDDVENNARRIAGARDVARTRPARSEFMEGRNIVLSFSSIAAL
jgi:hypothetical protein